MIFKCLKPMFFTNVQLQVAQVVPREGKTYSNVLSVLH